MPTTRPINFSAPDDIYDFLMSRANRSAYIANLVRQDEECQAWMKGKA
jgi:hypothetical protein